MAVIVALWLSSGVLSFTVVTGKVAVFCPLEIVTLDGTVASLVSLEARFTSSAPAVPVLRQTVPVVALAWPSGASLLASVSRSAGPSSLRTVMATGGLVCRRAPVTESST